MPLLAGAARRADGIEGHAKVMQFRRRQGKKEENCCTRTMKGMQGTSKNGAAGGKREKRKKIRDLGTINAVIFHQNKINRRKI